MNEDPVELSVAGCLLDGGEEAVRVMDHMHALGFVPEAFQSVRVRRLWTAARNWMAAGTFTQAKLESLAMGSCIGDDAASGTTFTLEAIKRGAVGSMSENCMEVWERYIRREAEMELVEAGKASGVEILDEVETRIAALKARASFTLRDEKTEALNDLDFECVEMLAGRKTMRPTRIPAWDSSLGGLPDAQLIALCGRPGGGKTALSEQIIDECIHDGCPVLYIQRELSRSRALGRLIARRAHIPWSRFEMRTMTHDQIQDFQAQVERYRGLPIHLAPVTRCTGATLGQLIRSHSRNHGVKLVVMDYVQLIDLQRGQDRRNAIGEATKAMKLAANETGVTIIAIAQLNREAEKNGKPTLSGIKESGDIEQDADAVLALWLSEDREDRSEWPVNWSVLKNRNGGLGTTTINFNGPSMSFL